MLQIGDQFDRFVIRSFIAQGGMADIYHAHDLMNGKDVVLKIPNRMFIGDPAQYERFQRELEVSNTLSHPAIQRGLGSGQYNRTPYLVTEFVQGESMRQMIDKQAPLPVEDALALIRKITDAAAYIHENGVIHRDLKPENIIISSEGQPVILDFGLALTRGARRVTYAALTPTAGNAGLYGSRTDRRAARRCADGYLRAGCDSLRTADGTRSLWRGRRCGGDDSADARRGSPAGPGTIRRVAPGSGGDRPLFAARPG